MAKKKAKKNLVSKNYWFRKKAGVELKKGSWGFIPINWKGWTALMLLVIVNVFATLYLGLNVLEGKRWAKFGIVFLLSILVFILIASLIVFNTIRVAIYTHRQEIGVMKLVGATNWFIRSPFLLEAVVYGIIACVAGIAIVYPMLNFVQPYVNNFFLTTQFSLTGYFTDNFWAIFGLELLMIILINIISSSVAIRKYLKV